MTFWRYLARIFVRPKDTLEMLKLDAGRMRLGAGSIFGMSLLYTLVSVNLAVIVSARLSGARGSFDNTVALLGFATAAATLPALAPDLALTAVQVIGLMDYDPWFYSVTHGGAWFYVVWTYLAAYIVYFCILYPQVSGGILDPALAGGALVSPHGRGPASSTSFFRRSRRRIGVSHSKAAFVLVKARRSLAAIWIRRRAEAEQRAEAPGVIGARSIGGARGKLNVAGSGSAGR